MLIETARIGATDSKGGVCRLTLTDLDRQVRDWFKQQCEALGCTVTIDEVGNMFALPPGQQARRRPIAMGGHLDTQPTGGKFDGALGVLGGLEVVRTLHDLGYETNAPVDMVNWTNEEGSRFAPAMLGSGVFAGVFDRRLCRRARGCAEVSAWRRLGGDRLRGPVAAAGVPVGAISSCISSKAPSLKPRAR